MKARFTDAVHIKAKLVSREKYDGPRKSLQYFAKKQEMTKIQIEEKYGADVWKSKEKMLQARDYLRHCEEIKRRCQFLRERIAAQYGDVGAAQAELEELTIELNQ